MALDKESSHDRICGAGAPMTWCVAVPGPVYDDDK